MHRWDFGPVWAHADLLLLGLWHTLQVTGTALAFGIPLGLALALSRLSPRRLLRWPAGAVIEVFRTTPPLVQLFWFFFALPILIDVEMTPFVAAALQVYWTRLAVQLGNVALQPLDVPGVCPCCGALPSASVIGSSAEFSGMRFLHCSLCNTEWHLTRASCSACDAGESAVAYQHIEGDKGLVQAETCDVCKSYLKVVRRDKDAAVDPVADDLATLALDILVDESGFSRSGPNLLLVPGGG